MIKRIQILLLFAFLIPNLAISQTTNQNDSLLKSAKVIMTASSTSCAMITIDKNGIASVRAMDPFTPEADFTVWFGTNSQSRKVSHIRNNPKVTLYYLDNNNSEYVTLHGMAQLIDDAKTKERKWKKEWADFYPNKSENYILITFEPLWLEVVSPSRSVFGDSITWKPKRVFFGKE